MNNINFKRVFELLDKMEECANRIKELNGVLRQALVDYQLNHKGF
ncbi:hypothetical protein [Providencia rustigianii]|nr:hypothetical protein [Providencia rustigianii]